MNQWKSGHAVKTKARSLADALIDADAFLGLSVEGAVNKKWLNQCLKSYNICNGKSNSRNYA